MIKFNKLTALRLLATIVAFPYSANAAASCLDNLNYNPFAGADSAYETVTYQAPADKCQDVFQAAPAGFSI